MHYFHKRLIASLQKPTLLKSAPQTPKDKRKKIERNERISNDSDATSAKASEVNIPDLDTVKNLFRAFIKRSIFITKHFLKDSKDVAWHMLELHLIKLVYITAFICCINQVMF